MADTQRDWRAMFGDAAAVAASAKADADAAKALAVTVENSMKSAALVWEYYVTATKAMVVSLSLTGDRLLVPAGKAEIGDLVQIHPAGRPTVGAVSLGWLFFQSTGFVSAPGVVDVNCVFPAISVAGSLALPLRLRGFRPSAA